jgi:regulator of chromosome condensation
MSCGDKTQGRLGQGENTGDRYKFTEIEGLLGVDVKFIYAKKKHVLAITKTGKIYSWGCGEQG